MKNSKSILWGIVLIIVGLLLGLKSFNIITFDIFFSGWWTLFIIIPCFIGLISEKEKTGNLIGLIIGIILLLACLDILNFDIVWKLILPIIIVILGLSLIFKNTLKKEVNDKINDLNKNLNNEDGYFSAFSSQDLKLDKEEFKGTNLNAIFGGIKLDLRDAKIKNDVVINASAIFGGIDILVPNNIDIEIKSTSIFGGVSNNKKENKEDKKITIYINATCIFGGVEIK